jgi:hypothetical protein
MPLRRATEESAIEGDNLWEGGCDGGIMIVGILGYCFFRRILQTSDSFFSFFSTEAKICDVKDERFLGKSRHSESFPRQ